MRDHLGSNFQCAGITGEPARLLSPRADGNGNTTRNRANELSHGRTRSKTIVALPGPVPFDMQGNRSRDTRVKAGKQLYRTNIGNLKLSEERDEHEAGNSEIQFALRELDRSAYQSEGHAQFGAIFCERRSEMQPSLQRAARLCWARAWELQGRRARGILVRSLQWGSKYPSQTP